MQALLGRTSEARWLRYAHAQLRHLFPYLPQQPGYNKRLRRLADTLAWLIAVLARDTGLWADDVWVVDSTPVECARSRQAAHRSALAGWAEYGYCASHSRYFWGLRLHLLCTLHGLPVGFALSGAKADEREVLLGILDADPALAVGRDGQTVIADRHYYGRQFETTLTEHGITLLRPARSGEAPRPGAGLFKAPGQGHGVDDGPLKSPPRRGPHGGHTPAGVWVRILQRVLALTTAIWHNDHIGAPTPRSLIA